MTVLCVLTGAASEARAQGGPVNSTWEWRTLGDRQVLVETHGDPVDVMGTAAVAAPRSGRLAATWCGQERAADDTANETGERGLHKVKVIEAIPSDRVASADVRDEIQASVATIVEKLASESGGRKSLRFDLGTSCGGAYADILTMKLPKAAADYGAGACNAGPLFGDVQRLLPSFPGPRNFIIYAPTIDCAGIAGYAEAPPDDSPGAGNDANQGGYMAVSFYTDGRTALHEIGHNLGAVQYLAPHTDGTRHCWDNHDILCYPYTEFLPQSPLRPCAFEDDGLGPFDCNQDDYFSPAPAAGSYLATHWNTYDSLFMCELDSCVPAALAPPPDTGPAPVAPAPVAPAPGSPAPEPSEPHPHAAAQHTTAPAPPPAKPGVKKSERAKPSARALRAARKRCRKVKGAKRRAACVKRALKRRR